jgi:hypothetical protein
MNFLVLRLFRRHIKVVAYLNVLSNPSEGNIAVFIMVVVAQYGIMSEIKKSSVSVSITDSIQ